MLQLLAHPWPTRQQTLPVLHQVSQGQIYNRARTLASFPLMEIFGILNILILSSQRFLSHRQITLNRSQDCFQNTENMLDYVINQRYRLLFLDVVRNLFQLILLHSNKTSFLVWLLALSIFRSQNPILYLTREMTQPAAPPRGEIAHIVI